MAPSGRGKEWASAYKSIAKLPPSPQYVSNSSHVKEIAQGPSAWVLQTLPGAGDVTISGAGRVFSGQKGMSFRTLRTNLPMPPKQRRSYFEATVVAADPGVVMSIGVVPVQYPGKNALPGWIDTSVGYHSHNGHIYVGSQTPTHDRGYINCLPGQELPHFGVGDTVGVLYDNCAKAVLFTLNGRLLSRGTGADKSGHDFSRGVVLNFSKHTYFPAIGADGSCSIRFNSGAAPFAMSEYQRYRLGNFGGASRGVSAADPSSTPTSPAGAPPPRRRRYSDDGIDISMGADAL